MNNYAVKKLGKNVKNLSCRFGVFGILLDLKVHGGSKIPRFRAFLIKNRLKSAVFETFEKSCDCVRQAIFAKIN